MKKRILLLIGILLFIPNLKVKAIEACSNEELQRLQELANSFSITAEEIIEERVDDEDGSKYIYSYYKLTPHNMDKELRIYSEEEERYYYNVDINEITNGEYFSDKFVFKVYSFTESICTGRVLKTITLDLPEYNSYYYYHKEKCQEYPEFKYCVERIESKDKKKFNKTDEEIDKLFDEYIKEQTPVEKTKNVIENIKDNYLLIIGISIGIIFFVIIIFIIIKKKKKNEL